MSCSTRVYVGRLPGSVRQSDLERFFKGYGKIREITLKEGYGFIEFNDKRDAEDAVYELNGKELCGDRIIVEHAKPPGERRGGGRGGRGGFGDRYSGGRDGSGSRGGGYRSNSGPAGFGYRQNTRNPAPPRTEHRVIVENLSSRVSWQDLKDYMRKGGEVIYADAHKLRPNEGVVEFASADDMRKAISTLNDTELSGRRIRLVEERQQSGGRNRRSRSRSDSRSRSRSRSRSQRSDSRSRSRSRSRTPYSSRSKSQDAE